MCCTSKAWIEYEPGAACDLRDLNAGREAEFIKSARKKSLLTMHVHFVICEEQTVGGMKGGATVVPLSSRSTRPPSLNPPTGRPPPVPSPGYRKLSSVRSSAATTADRAISKAPLNMLKDFWKKIFVFKDRFVEHATGRKRGGAGGRSIFHIDLSHWGCKGNAVMFGRLG